MMDDWFPVMKRDVIITNKSEVNTPFDMQNEDVSFIHTFVA